MKSHLENRCDMYEIGSKLFLPREISSDLPRQIDRLLSATKLSAPRHRDTAELLDQCNGVSTRQAQELE
jgi:hypothetical protein